MQIKVNDISKIYGTNENKVTALKAASMTIFEGDFISIMIFTLYTLLIIKR